MLHNSFFNEEQILSKEIYFRKRLQFPKLQDLNNKIHTHVHSTLPNNKQTTKDLKKKI